MRRAWFPLLLIVLLAACSSAPSRRTGTALSSSAAPRVYRTNPNLPTFVDHSVGEEEISIQAMSLVGVPYRWGGNTPTSGFDCSGLVHYVVARAAQVDLPRTTAAMSTRGTSIEPDEIAPGDLIFFNTTGRPHSHVGIYVGKMRFVNAPSTGGTVRIDYVSNPYWAKRFDGIRRMASNPVKPTPFDAPQLLAAPVARPPARQPAFAAAAREDAVPVQPALAATPAMESLPRPGMAAAQPAAPNLDESPSQAPDMREPGGRKQAAVDPYEPAPPAAVAAQQAQAAQRAEPADNGAPSRPAPIVDAVPTREAPSQPDPGMGVANDPIARFATGNF